MEQLEVERVLDWFDGFNSIQRLILSTAGTLQTTLTALFLAPVRVEVMSQSQVNHYTIDRTVELRAGDMTVCRAISHIVCVRQNIMDDILLRKIGLGQILTKHDIRPVFKMTNVGQDDKSFWRRYKLIGLGVVYDITEIFPKELYATPSASQT